MRFGSGEKEDVGRRFGNSFYRRKLIEGCICFGRQDYIQSEIEQTMKCYNFIKKHWKKILCYGVILHVIWHIVEIGFLAFIGFKFI